MLNTYLENENNKINGIILELQFKKEPLTFDKIIGRHQNNASLNSFLSFAYKELEKEKSTHAAKTYEDNTTSLNSLKEM